MAGFDLIFAAIAALVATFVLFVFGLPILAFG